MEAASRTRLIAPAPTFAGKSIYQVSTSAVPGATDLSLLGLRTVDAEFATV
jgi:hypothetical protein